MGPTSMPTNTPTRSPTNDPTPTPTWVPTNDPTVTPTQSPTNRPTKMPTNSPTFTPTAQSCSDGVQTGAETDIDCGGSFRMTGCPRCDAGKRCVVNSDCSSSSCPTASRGEERHLAGKVCDTPKPT